MIPAVATTPSSSPTSKWLPEEQRIQMAIRMRPLNSREKKSTTRGKNAVWRVDEREKSILQTTAEGVHRDAAGNGNHRAFKFAQSSTRTFDDRSSNREVYDGVVKGVVSDVLRNGNDKTVCAYGQIASGKTFIMQGEGRISEVLSGDHNGDDDDNEEDNDDNDNLGIIHMAARDIFEWIDDVNSHDDDHRSVRVSYVEIFNEEVRDLLETQSRSSSSTRDIMANNDADATLRIVDSKLVNPKMKTAESFDGLMAILAEGEKNRHVAATAMNDRCSRSHTFLRFTMESIATDNDNNNDNGEVTPAVSYSTTSTLTLVDLAGSESTHNAEIQQRPPPRQKTYTEPLQRIPSHHQKKTTKKNGKIKESLLVLSRVINCLGGTSGVDIPPFRESKLTQLLKPALLGENGALAIVFCVSPSEAYLDETISTLKFAERAGRAKPQKSSSMSVSVASEKRARLSLVGERDAGVVVGGQRRRMSLLEGTAVTPSGGKNTPSKRRSRLVSPYKRRSPAVPSPRRATPSRTTTTISPSSKFEQHESMAEKSARISCLEAKLRETERKLEAQACEMEALRSTNRELESRSASPRKSRRVTNGDRLGGGSQQLMSNVPIIGEDCSGQDTLASSFQSEDYPGSPKEYDDVVNVAAIDFGGAAEELANGRAKIDELERLVSQLQGENGVLRSDADPAEKKKATSASEIDGDDLIRRPTGATVESPRSGRISETNEVASLLDGKALDFGTGYSTFEDTAKRGDYSLIPMNDGNGGRPAETQSERCDRQLGTRAKDRRQPRRRATPIVDRFERISDLIESAMGIAGESS